MESISLEEQGRVRANSESFYRRAGERIKLATRCAGEWLHLNRFREDLVEASIANCLTFADAFLPVIWQRAHYCKEVCMWGWVRRVWGGGLVGW